MDFKSFALGYNACASQKGGSVSQAELEAAIRNVVPEWALEENPPEVDADPEGTAQTLVDDLARQTARDLANYYTKDQTLTKDEINTLVSAIPKFDIEVVASLPIYNISETTVYLVKSGDDDTNLYTEYIRAGGKWEKLGTQTVDLTGYATEAWVNDILAAYAKIVDMEAYVTEALNGYLTKEEADETYQPVGDYLTPTTGDRRYAKPSDIPTVPQTLPNPYALNILGKTYNGSSAVALTVEEIIEAIKTASGGVVAYLDGNRLVLSGNLPDATYTAYYEVNGELIEIGDLTLGSITPDPVTYTIRWVNYDDTVLEIDEEVPEGVTPEYNGSTPTKPADSQYTYTFKGWDKTVVAATADATYTATYTQTAIGVEPAEPTNFFDTSGDGYLNPGRLSSGGADRTDSAVCLISNYIPVQTGDIVYVNGCYIAPTSNGSNTHYTSCYNGSKVHISSARNKTSNSDITFDTITLTSAQITVTGSAVEYLRFTCCNQTTNGSQSLPDTSKIVINIKRGGAYL